MDERIRVVRDGYDAMAPEYVAWAARIEDLARTRFVADLLGRLEPGSSVVDLGCGAGVPSTVPMYFSAFEADQNLRLIDAEGLIGVADEVVTIDEPEGPASFLWALAQRALP